MAYRKVVTAAQRAKAARLLSTGRTAQVRSAASYVLRMSGQRSLSDADWRILRAALAVLAREAVNQARKRWSKPKSATRKAASAWRSKPKFMR